MVINGIWQEKKFTLSHKSNCLTLSLDEGQWSNVYSFDHTGRLWTAMVEGISYRRGLDGKVVARWLATENTHQRRWLTQIEAVKIITSGQQVAHNLLMATRSGEVSLPIHGSLSSRIELSLQKAAAFTPQQAEMDASVFKQIYKPIGILPPDQYMAVVLQLTEGCSYNGCTFCSFYRDRPFHIKTPAEFTSHIESVKDYLGDGMSLRRTIFLGDANAVVVPMNKLTPLMELVHQYLPVDSLGGMYAFLDGFSAHRKTIRDYQTLANLGLKRIYIGLESGNSALLEFLNNQVVPLISFKPFKPLKLEVSPWG